MAGAGGSVRQYLYKILTEAPGLCRIGVLQSMLCWSAQTPISLVWEE